MPRARKHLVCVSETPDYLVTSRCVRRAFLCGIDQLTGKSYEHRRDWIEDRIRELSSIFSIGISSYAVMSNHFHLVAHLNPAESDSWSDDEVLKRWSALARGPELVQRYLAGDSLLAAESTELKARAARYRQRLGNLSWFMKYLNEPIARRANAEDDCTGHFWESRFHSRALRSEAALLAAMAYVDLNPVRAGLAKTPEQSEYTSIRARIRGTDRQPAGRRGIPGRPLMPFSDEAKEPTQPSIPMRKLEYLTLVDQTGRIAVRGKRGVIHPSLLPILSRLGLSATDWLCCSTNFPAYLRGGELRLARVA